MAETLRNSVEFIVFIVYSTFSTRLWGCTMILLQRICTVCFCDKVIIRMSGVRVEDYDVILFEKGWRSNGN